jgi:acyl carrier protein
MILEKVQEALVNQLGIDAEDITEDSKIMEDLGADSLDVIELVMILEEEFDMEIPDSDIEELSTVGDVVEYIKEHR